MTAFETYLIENGYEKFAQVFKGKEWHLEKTDCDYFSSMANLHYVYVKEDRHICFGLNEAGKPPTLICPRPRILVSKPEGVIDKSFDDAMNIVLREIPFDTIMTAMFDKRILITIKA